MRARARMRACTHTHTKAAQLFFSGEMRKVLLKVQWEQLNYPETNVDLLVQHWLNYFWLYCTIKGRNMIREGSNRDCSLWARQDMDVGFL